jgi:DNA-damage-inducible protein D
VAIPSAELGMNKEIILKMSNQFDSLVRTHPDALDVEFWFVRDLQEPLGYARWENFLTTIQRAIDSCKTTGCAPEHHFRGVTKMVDSQKLRSNSRAKATGWAAGC